MDVRFDGAVLDGVEFRECKFLNCSFKQASAKGTRFCDFVFEGCDAPEVEPAPNKAEGDKKEMAAAQAKTEKVEYPVYLVDVDWFSEDQGGMPNHFSFPSVVTTSAEDARGAYEKFAADDHEWNRGSRGAYLVGVRPDGGFDLLEGAKPW